MLQDRAGECFANIKSAANSNGTKVAHNGVQAVAEQCVQSPQNSVYNVYNSVQTGNEHSLCTLCYRLTPGKMQLQLYFKHTGTTLFWRHTWIIAVDRIVPNPKAIPAQSDSFSAHTGGADEQMPSPTASTHMSVWRCATTACKGRATKSRLSKQGSNTELVFNKPSCLSALQWKNSLQPCCIDYSCIPSLIIATMTAFLRRLSKTGMKQPTADTASKMKTLPMCSPKL
jgi:hypothetical protein